MQNNIKLNKQLLHILKIPYMLYSNITLRKELMKKLQKKSQNYYFLTQELQTFLNEPLDNISIYSLVEHIITFYSENANKPNCEYFSYDQKPNHNLFIPDKIKDKKVEV